MTKKEYPLQGQLDDFCAWYDDLSSEKQNNLGEAIDSIEEIPEFSKEWTVRELWTAVRDFIGA